MLFWLGVLVSGGFDLRCSRPGHAFSFSVFDWSFVGPWVGPPFNTKLLSRHVEAAHTVPRSDRPAYGIPFVVFLLFLLFLVVMSTCLRVCPRFSCCFHPLLPSPPLARPSSVPFVFCFDLMVFSWMSRLRRTDGTGRIYARGWRLTGCGTPSCWLRCRRLQRRKSSGEHRLLLNLVEQEGWLGGLCFFCVCVSLVFLFLRAWVSFCLMAF